jgi:hypothetical protein
MAMNSNELLLRTGEWLNDPALYSFEPTNVLGAVQHAYAMIVNEVERASQTWNTVSVPIEISVTHAAREYTVTTIAAGETPNQQTDSVRKIVEVVRTDAGREDKLAIIAHGSRNDYRSVNYYPQLQRFRGSVGLVYVYRASDGLWRVGFVDAEPPAQTISVFYVPKIGSLAGQPAYPSLVPDDFHEMIALQAAVVLKVQENRDASGLLGMLAQWKSDLNQFCMDVTSGQQARAI